MKTAKRQLSLKWFVILAFLSLGILLVIGFSLLTASYFVRGMDSIVASDMEKAALSFIDLVPPEKREQLSSFSGYLISHEWEQMPESVREQFKKPPETPGLMYKRDDSGWLHPPDIITFGMRFEHRGETLYIAHRSSAATAPKSVGQEVDRNMRALLIISVLSALIFAAIIWMLIHRVSRPVAALGQWTRSLDPEKLNMPAPDFLYPELNELAELIRTSLTSVQDTLEREHHFLRHTSHELRTPINVIRNNIELIRKLQQDSDQPWDPKQASVIDRIDRASLTMQHLTEILLWLSRDVAKPPSQQEIRLDDLVRLLVDELGYLLKHKHVEVKLETHPCVVKLAEIPARIVIGNLIRNAFQHTWDGEVIIRQEQNEVEVVNIQKDADKDSEHQDLGFGLGLKLTAQLTTKLGWTYTNVPGPQGHHARIMLGTLVNA